MRKGASVRGKQEKKKGEGAKLTSSGTGVLRFSAAKESFPACLQCTQLLSFCRSSSLICRPDAAADPPCHLHSAPRSRASLASDKHGSATLSHPLHPQRPKRALEAASLSAGSGSEASPPSSSA